MNPILEELGKESEEEALQENTRIWPVKAGWSGIYKDYSGGRIFLQYSYRLSNVKLFLIALCIQTVVEPIMYWMFQISNTIELITPYYLLTRRITSMVLRIFGIKLRGICANLMVFLKRILGYFLRNVNGVLTTVKTMGYGHLN